MGIHRVLLQLEDSIQGLSIFEISVPHPKQGYNKFDFSNQFISFHIIRVPAFTMLLGFGEMQVGHPFIFHA